MADSSQIEQVTFKAGDILFNENEQSFHFFIIQDGEVEVFRTAPDGSHVVLAKVGAGNSLGEFAMLDRQPRSASARALTNLNCARVSEDAYEQLLAELPDWAVSVMRALVERLRNTNEIVRKAQVGATTQKELESAEFTASAVRRAAAEDEDNGTVTDVNLDFSQFSEDRQRTGGKPKKT